MKVTLFERAREACKKLLPDDVFSSAELRDAALSGMMEIWLDGYLAAPSNRDGDLALTLAEKIASGEFFDDAPGEQLPDAEESKVWLAQYRDTPGLDPNVDNSGVRSCAGCGCNSHNQCWVSDIREKKERNCRHIWGKTHCDGCMSPQSVFDGAMLPTVIRLRGPSRPVGPNGAEFDKAAGA